MASHCSSLCSKLEKTNKRLEFENIRLKENNEIANEELEQLKQTNKSKWQELEIKALYTSVPY